MKLKGDNNLKLQARNFYNRGFNICHVINEKNDFNLLEPNLLKAPAVPYQHLYNKRQEDKEFDALKLDEAVGIGIILGFNDLMAIDVDGCVDFGLIGFICNELGLPQNYKWIVKSGSQVGFHIILRCLKHNSLKQSFGQRNVDSFYPSPLNYIPEISLLDSDLQIDYYDKAKLNNYDIDKIHNYFEANFTLRNLFQKIEFGWKGFLVIPPSLHSSGNNYEFVNGIPNCDPTIVDFEKLELLRDSIASIKRSYSTIKQEVEDLIEENEKKYETEDETEYIFFDIVSNGSPKDYNDYDKMPRLVQLSWLIVNSNLSLIRKEDFLIQVGNIPLERKIYDVHGLNSEILNFIGYPIKAVLNKFITDVEKCKGKIISHNFELNSNIIKGELLRYGLNARILSNKENECTMSGILTTMIFNNRSNAAEPISLEDLYYELFSKELNVCNNAFSKALVCKICYEKMFGRYSDQYLE